LVLDSLPGSKAKAQGVLFNSSAENLGAGSSVPHWAAPLDVVFSRIITEIAGLGAFLLSHRSFVFLPHTKILRTPPPFLFPLQKEMI
jgi:hypothetical protein